MFALIIMLLLAVTGIAVAATLIGMILAFLYTIPYYSWARRQHAAGRYTAWPPFSPRFATKLYLAKLTRSAI